MSKHRGGGQPAFSRLFTSLKRHTKKRYKEFVHRRNRKKLHQSDLEEHKDKPLDPWTLD